MRIPQEYATMYEHYMNQSAKGVEKVTISIEMVLAMIEKIAELDIDSKNLGSYLHVECRRTAQKKIDELETEIRNLRNKA